MTFTHDREIKDKTAHGAMSERPRSRARTIAPVTPT